MAGWNTPARNAAISKRPCDQKTRQVFGHCWQGQHRSEVENAPKWGRLSTSRCSVRHRCSWRALHQIQYPDRSRGALIFIEDFSREASSLHGNGLFCVLRRVAGARRGSAAYPPIAAVPGRRRQRQSWAMCGRLRVGKGFLYACSSGRSSHVFGLLARFT